MIRTLLAGLALVAMSYLCLNLCIEALEHESEISRVNTARHIETLQQRGLLAVD